MKIRSGFVSNSSSSSFIVMGHTDHIAVPKFNKKQLNIPQDFGGNYQFGWEEIEYNKFNDRLNWAALCALYQREQTGDLSWLDLLCEVLKEDLNVNDVSINFDLTHSEEIPDTVFAYIDHQSGPAETPANAIMFSSKLGLRTWLYAPDSVIVGGNDNS
jgi:hypothetical protein